MAKKLKPGEKPILFSTPMVQAILNGTKTQTRRVIKRKGYGRMHDAKNDLAKHEYDNLWQIGESRGNKERLRPLNSIGVFCPYPVGTRLWVRETWAMLYGFAPGEWEKLFPGTEPPDKSDNLYCYKADFSEQSLRRMKAKGAKWKSSRFMPKVAARIWLEVKNVRVEKLWDITDEDAMAEGISFDAAMEHSGWTPSFNDPDGSNAWPNYTEARKYLWNSLNSKRGYPFESSPWVWVYGFGRVE